MASSINTLSPLDQPWSDPIDAEELIEAAMDWHFDPSTGSTFWLERAKSFEFDPRKDVRSIADLTLFPNIVDELRDVPIRDLIPRGYGNNYQQPLIAESGGTTGPPKRLMWMAETLEQATAWHAAGLAQHGAFRRGGDWLCMGPTDPHMAGHLIRATAAKFDAMCFLLDLDPRWVKRLIERGANDEVALYVEHVVDQAEWILRSQDISVFYSTPPLLDALCRRGDMVDLINERVDVIGWGGTKMDTEVRNRYQREVFPGVKFIGGYASTMIVGGIVERANGIEGDSPVFDPPSPVTMFSVIDPATGTSVPYGQRGQVLQHHISRGLLLPNNLERDSAIRMPHPRNSGGDSIADVQPVTQFSGKPVVEGVY
ncbi:long-chain fatty acid--CoA ligase [Micromonospora sp. ALFpr18c]|uniref:AMP-binding protein n=1 Tax=unclassified Micromonospora TaxID=2617518 RepID=UPI00124AFB30|nr:AMP-binding protein [Micromonospora sp. ALFpr18c]KAB1933870.1 long-chain fatty acid--CoA ligase [Micromonospora sp. ALFpr18c]